MSKKDYTMHVLSHTHWDREWYQDFQGFRQRLVFQIDALMDLLETHPEYKYFHFDGQTICIDDYLQIRPESRERLKKHIQSGQILIGPWFVMPDELLLSGESMVRNFLLGHKTCDEFETQPMPIGYVTDIFGHCSQFPQILRGFDIDSVILNRGIGNELISSEMLWEGADGSNVLLVKVFHLTGYGDFSTHKESDEETLLEYEQHKTTLANTHVLFALDGNDHTPAFWNTPESIEKLNKIFKNITCVHSSIPNYLNSLKAELGDFTKAGLVKLQGELRIPKKTGKYAELFHGTASSRVPLKQQNDHLEYLLPRCAEAFHAWSTALGGDSQKPFLDLAWRYLISNHPHDSIVGCSLDQVHKDMEYRFDQARLLGRNSIYESMQAIGDRLNTSSLGESDAVVTVYNPASVALAPTAEFTLELPSHIFNEKRKQGLQPILVDEDGNQAYFEIIATDSSGGWPTPPAKKTHGDSPNYFNVPDFWIPQHRFDVIAASPMQAFGYKSWAVKYASKTTKLPDTVHPVVADDTAKTLENEYLKIKIREDALIDIYDKQTGAWFNGLHELEDCGDTGNGWDHTFPKSDTIIKSSDNGAKSEVKVHLEQTGKLLGKAEIKFNLKVPADLDKKKTARIKRKVSLPVTISLTLKSGSRRVDFETNIENTTKCHRLRALFPTHRNADTWLADSAFDAVERNIKLIDTTCWDEQAREETPIKNFAAVKDDKAGFAILTKGLCEACVKDDSEKTLTLTLFRGFEQQIGMDGYSKDSLLLGNLKLNYSIVPFTPDDNPAITLFKETERYKLHTYSLTSKAHEGDMPHSGSFLETPEGLVVSTIKTSEDGNATIVRLFNPGTSDISGKIKACPPFAKAWTCNFLEGRDQELSVTDGFEITIKAKKIVNIRLERA